MNNLHLRDGKVAFRWKRWRNKKRQEVSYCLMVLFSGAVLLGAGGMAIAGPTGGQVTSGTGTISQAGTTTTIDQTSNVLDINWQTFSTAPNEAVNFNQPGSTSLAINRVIGGVPSYLQGALNANGRVFILNSAGVTFTGTSHVNVGALLATTAMSVGGDPNQLASFSAPAGSYGSVVNEGSITVSNGGFAILAAPYVQNTGFIKADLGTVALAGTNSFTLDLRGDGLINFVVPPGAAEQIAADGKRVGVDNSGTLQARSGQVIVSASVATQVVNAVVNLTGVVDADALAANGAGGSVLVTSTGDINLGGTVTAQGNGTGAGGQIVTKAAALDNIEQGAIVNAAGGSQGGKGGLVEVSGHDVKVVGSVHAGAGGKLVIDPATIDIVPSGASNGTDIFTEAFVKAHTASSLLYSAAKDIIFTATGPSHTLALTGGGALVLKAGSSIIFDAGNYIIDNGAAAVRMTATNGDIGNTTHRLSVISSVDQAGDIVLNALGGSIYLQDVTVKSLGGNGHDAHAKFSANADNTINIAGAVYVEATVDGASAVHADALANLHAFDITVNGPVTVLANAVGFGIDVTEQANAEFYAIANTASVDGKVELGNTLDVEAHINGSEAVNLLLATASVELNGTRVDVVGNTKVIASAADFADPFSVDAHANLFVHAAPSFSISTVGGVILDRILGGTQDFNSASIHFHQGIDVEANAFVPVASALHVTASANVVLDAAHITVDGPAKVAASATAHSAGQMVANAFLLAQLGQAHFSTSGSVSTVNGTNKAFSGRVAGTAHVGANDVTFGNTITVTADARTFAHSVNGVRADAEAHLAGFSVDVAGKVTVSANATNSGDGQVSAEALLLVDYADIKLVATASDLNGVLDWVDSNIGGSFADLIGNFIDHSGSRSSDAVQVNLAAHLGGSAVNLEDGLDVEALAKATHDGVFFTPGNVTALASATLAGRLITVAGPAVVNASAVGSSHDGFVDAKARLVTDLIGADGTVAFGFIDGDFSTGTFVGTDGSLKFDAHFGGGTSGSDNFIAGETKFVNGFDVTAFANGFDVAGVKAEASAHLVTDDLDVFSSATVSASAQGEEVFFGVGAVSRLTADNLDFTLSSPELVGVGSSRTLVQFRLGGSDVSFQKGFDVQAYANGLRLELGSVYAEADVTLAAHSHQVQQQTADGSTSTFGVGGNVRIGGPATVKASANGSYTDVVRAEATLIAEGGSFSTNYSGKARDFASHFAANSVNFSAVDVETKVYGNEIFDALVGSAWGEFFANHVNMNGLVAVTANTVHHSNDGSHEPYVVANAVLIAADRESSQATCCGPDVRNRDVIGSGASITFNQGIDVEANANGSLAFGVTARAFVELEASTGERFAVTLVPNSSGHGDITVNGNIEVLANASGHRNHFSDEGFVGASADFSARGFIRTFSSGTDFFERASRSEARDITLTNNLDVEANANGHNVAFVGAFADASLDAFDSEFVGGVAKVKATAHGSTADGVEAEAELHSDPGFLNFAGGFDVEANANARHALFECAFATASLDAGSALVGGPAVVLANAHGTSVDGVEAGARIETDAYYLTFSSGFDVEANASEFQTADGNFRGFFVEAFANASLDAVFVNVAGPADVFANAHGTSVDGVEARAEIFTDPVFLTFAKGFDVEANATDDFGFQVTANATADFSADFINVGGRGIVLANAHGDFMDGVTASAFLLVEATTANFANGFDVEAKANGLNTRENEVAWASANFSLDGLSVGGPAGQGAKVIASATEFNTHDGGASEVFAVSRLQVGAGSFSTGDFFEHGEASTAVFNGGIDVEAHTVASDTRFVGASASAVISARHIGIGHGATVKETDSAFFASSVDGAAKLVVDGGSEGFFNSSASGRHRFYFEVRHFNADTAVVQGINVQARSKGVDIIDRSFVGAFGSASVYADNVFLSGVTRVNGTATGDDVGRIDAVADLHIGDQESAGSSAGTVHIQGPIRVGAYANVTSTGLIIPLVDDGGRVGDASAFASVDIDARRSITIVGSGGFGPNFGSAITVTAIADPQHLADHAEATAELEVDADASSQDSSNGNLTIIGNVTVTAEALGLGPNNFAGAFIGLSTSFASDTGHPHHIGLAGDNVTIAGNIRSLAFADSVSDEALARLWVLAKASHGDILLIETQDPIALAIAGDPAIAFKQSHVTTNTQVPGSSGAFASANIIIQAGPEDSGSVVVEPPNQDQIQALRALVTYQPPGNEGSSSLNLIPLTIQHQDCGNLGGAGNPNGNGPNCDKGPYDITETDTLP